MKPIFFVIALCGVSTIFSSCGSQNVNTQNGDTIPTKLIQTGENFSIEKTYIDSTRLPVSDSMNIEIFKSHAPVYRNEELPKSYTDRTFIKFSTSTYNLYFVPGHIVELKPNGDYERVTLMPLIRNGKSAATQLISDGDGIIYSNKINKSCSFNGSAIIGSLTVSDKQMMELLIQDMSISFVPDSLIDTASVRRAISQVSPERRKNLFYVRNATLTFVNYKTYTENKFDAKVTATYFTAGGSTFSSVDKFSRQRIVSVELTALDRLIQLLLP